MTSQSNVGLTVNDQKVSPLSSVAQRSPVATGGGAGVKCFLMITGNFWVAINDCA
jgi:hypothetical protein